MNKYKLQIKLNNGVIPDEYYKGNGAYAFFVELDIEGNHLLIYYFQAQVWLEVNLVPQLSKRIIVDMDDLYTILTDADVFFKYSNQIIDTYIAENKINFECN
jgi:hypothetical protein